LVMLDLRLPDIDGIEVLKKLRGQGSVTPALILTGYGSIPSAFEAGTLGVVAYLQKPVFGEILMAEGWSACRFTTTDGARPPLFRSPVGNGDGNRVDLLEMVTQIISLGHEPAQMRDRLARSLARRLPKPNITFQEFVSCSSALRVTMQADRSQPWPI